MTPNESEKDLAAKLFELSQAMANDVGETSTHVIESAFSIVETVRRNVKRWRAGDQIERWVGSGLLVAERQFRRVIGHRQTPSCCPHSLMQLLRSPLRKELRSRSLRIRGSLTSNRVPGYFDGAPMGRAGDDFLTTRTLLEAELSRNKFSC
jgi:hypothetical protein